VSSICPCLGSGEAMFGFISYKSLLNHRVHLPGLAPVRRERLLKPARIGVMSETRSQDSPAIIWILIVELPTPVFQLADGKVLPAHLFGLSHHIDPGGGGGYAARCDNQLRDGLPFARNARPALIFVLLPILAGHPIKRGSNHRSIQQNLATSSMVYSRTGTETVLNELTENPISLPSNAIAIGNCINAVRIVRRDH